MSALPRLAHPLTLEDYVRIEHETGLRHEFHAGEVFAMAGGTRRHALLAANMIAELRAALRDRDCTVYGSDLRVRAPAPGAPEQDLLTYPDATVVCGPAEVVEPADTLVNPVLLAEVLSPSTEAYDRGAKFRLYRCIPSLREYVLVWQDRRAVEVYRLGDDGRWALHDTPPEAAAVELASLGVALPLDGLYAKVELDPHPRLHPEAGEAEA